MSRPQQEIFVDTVQHDLCPFDDEFTDLIEEVVLAFYSSTSEEHLEELFDSIVKDYGNENLELVLSSMLLHAEDVI
jgi:hypothetical protein